MKYISYRQVGIWIGKQSAPNHGISGAGVSSQPPVPSSLPAAAAAAVNKRKQSGDKSTLTLLLGRYLKLNQRQMAPRLNLSLNKIPA